MIEEDDRCDPCDWRVIQRCNSGNRDGESSAPAAFVYVADVTRERRNRSAGTHTRSPPDPFRAPAPHAPCNEHTSRPEADRIDVAPRGERCVCLLLRNDAVQSQAKSRRCSFHFARNRRQALKASSQRRHALAFVQGVCSPQWRAIARGRRLMSDSIQTSVWRTSDSFVEARKAAKESMTWTAHWEGLPADAKRKVKSGQGDRGDR